MEKEKFLTAVFMTIVSFVCSFFGDMIFGFFTDGGIGAAMGFCFISNFSSLLDIKILPE